MRIAIAAASGALFGLGLVVSDMIDPERVIWFLKITSGRWDPTLAFVMGGAMIPMIAAWMIARRRPAPFAGGAFPSPPTGNVDRNLIGGAALFGFGWGLVGFCPGPALAAFALSGWPVWLFVGSMLAGMALRAEITPPAASARST